MNYKLLPAAIAAATVMASSANAGDIVTYGKINLSYIQLENDQAGVIVEDNWDVATNASRIGIKGSEELTENLKIIFKLEYGIEPDGEGDDEFTGRNSYVGLQGNWGTIIAGEHDTPLKMSGKPVDLFNDDYLGDLKNSIAGENRESDIVMYKTPDMGGLAATIAIMPGDDSGEDGVDNDQNDGFADHISVALTYQADNVYAALAVDDNVNGLDTVRFSGSFQAGDLKLGALYQESETADSDQDINQVAGLKGAIGDVLSNPDFTTDIDEQESFVISAAYTIDNLVLKAQIVEASNEGRNNELDSSALTIGVDYKLSERTKLYSYYSELTVDSDDSIGLNEDYEYTAMGLVGIEHKF